MGPVCTIFRDKENIFYTAYVISSYAICHLGLLFVLAALKIVVHFDYHKDHQQ